MMDIGVLAQPRFASVMQALFFASIAQRNSQLRYAFRIFRKPPLMVTPQDLNEPGQPIGCAVPGWKPPPPPARAAMEGRFCRLEPLDVQAHAESLHAANILNADGSMWTYMAYGPFATLETYRKWVDGVAGGNDPMFFAIVDRATGTPAGVASYLRVDPANGCIEVGHLA